MLVQIEQPARSPYSFDEARDKKAFDIVSKVSAAVLERIKVS